MNPRGEGRLCSCHSFPLFVRYRREVQIDEGCKASEYLAQRLRELEQLPAA